MACPFSPKDAGKNLNWQEQQHSPNYGSMIKSGKTKILKVKRQRAWERTNQNPAKENLRCRRLEDRDAWVWAYTTETSMKPASQNRHYSGIRRAREREEDQRTPGEET